MLVAVWLNDVTNLLLVGEHERLSALNRFYAWLSNTLIISWRKQCIIFKRLWPNPCCRPLWLWCPVEPARVEKLYLPHQLRVPVPRTRAASRHPADLSASSWHSAIYVEHNNCMSAILLIAPAILWGISMQSWKWPLCSNPPAAMHSCTEIICNYTLHTQCKNNLSKLNLRLVCLKDLYYKLCTYVMYVSE